MILKKKDKYCYMDKNNKSNDNKWCVIPAKHNINTARESLSFTIGEGDAFYSSAEKCKVPVEVINEYLKVMRFSIDFGKVHEDDTFKLVYQVPNITQSVGKIKDKNKNQDKWEKKAKLLHAGYMPKGKKPINHYRFAHPDGTIAWYDADANPIMISPLQLIGDSDTGNIITSIYTKKGRLLVDKKGKLSNNPHKGIDIDISSDKEDIHIYAAADGKIEKNLPRNESAGYKITITHNISDNLKYETTYSHTRRGIIHMHIEKGQVIGYKNKEPIHAEKSGKITDIKKSDDDGHDIQIAHMVSPGYIEYTTYYVQELGIYVEQGQIIGLVGDTGNTSAEHLHYEIVEIKDKREHLHPLDDLPHGIRIPTFLKDPFVTHRKKISSSKEQNCSY